MKRVQLFIYHQIMMDRNIYVYLLYSSENKVLHELKYELREERTYRREIGNTNNTSNIYT